MADVASGSDLDTAPASGLEQQVLENVPADASADDAALNARIAEAAASTMGANLNDPRFNVGGTANDTTTGGAGSGQGNDGANNGDAGTGDSQVGDEQNANGGDAAGAGDGESTAQTGDQSGDQGVEQAPKVETAPTVAKDYTLTIQGADTVDVDGNKVAGKEYKVSSIDELPEDFQPRHNRQIMEIIKSFDKLEQTKAADEAAAAIQAEQAQAQATQAEMLNGWDREIKALQRAGQIDVPKLKPTDVNYLTDPAMKKVADVFAFMERTNKERTAAGNRNLIQSFADAFNKMELVDLRAKQADAAKQEVETAKLKAGVVGSGQARGGAPAVPTYVAGQAQDIRDLL